MADESPSCVSCKSKNEEISTLLQMIEEKDRQIKYLETLLTDSVRAARPTDRTADASHHQLNNTEIMRYSRQMILPQIGVNGQKRIKESSVLIVGAGGLGCPSGLYLAASGIGKIGIVDYDDVELSNVHRQVLHREADIGVPKCESFANSIKEVNSSVVCVIHSVTLNSKNAKTIINDYDVILDASDNVPTRYLLSDASVLLNKPLVSGSALRFEGQLIIYNYKGTPCYRCLYPMPPSSGATSNCSESGVMGPVTGVIGCLQALETIKIIVGLPSSFHNKMLYFDGEYGLFRVFKLRGKNPKCSICGDNAEIKELIDYELFCHAQAKDKAENISLLDDSKRVSCKDYKRFMDSNKNHMLLDVRPSTEFAICSLPNSVNIPLNILRNEENVLRLKNQIQKCQCDNSFVVCRRGNDSQRAVLILEDLFKESCTSWRDLKGGLLAWHTDIDSNFPVY